MSTEEKIRDKWLHRFDEAEAVMGKDAAEALKRLYDYYGTDWVDWLARLYDPETGAIYYSNSGRDYEGFMPDAESTCQALDILTFSGALGYDYKKELPEETASRCLYYIQKMQSPEDGYFYHAHWGKRQNSSRKGRDLSQCLQLIRRFGGKPLYPTADERIEAIAKAKEADKKEETTSENQHFLPHLLSKEAMLEYLDRLNVNADSHTAGHILSSQNSQIKAAGLSDFVCDYLDKKQYSDTGLWEIGANYRSLSGVIKVGAVYGGQGKPLKHGYEIIDSAIDVILSDEDPSMINYVFNPWGGLGVSIRSVENSNKFAKETGDEPPYDMNEVRARIYKRLPEMIDKTIEKLDKFRKPDGSYSFYQKMSLPYSQGGYVSIGADEGDVNGLACAMHYVLHAIFPCLGINNIPLCNEEHKARFIKLISEAKPVKKKPNPCGNPEIQTFEGGFGSRFSFPGVPGLDLSADPENPDNKTLRVVTEEGKVQSVCFDATDYMKPPVTHVKSFDASFDLYFDSASADGVEYGISICGEGEPALTLNLSLCEGKIHLSDCEQTFSALVGRIGEWHKIKIVYKPLDCGFEIQAAIDGKKALKKRAFETENGNPPRAYVYEFRMDSSEKTASTIYIDNLSCHIVP